MEREVLDRLYAVELKVKEVNSDTGISLKEIKSSVNELKELTHELKEKGTVSNEALTRSLNTIDREVAVQDEKIANVLFQISTIDKRIQDLECGAVKSQDSMRALVDKIIMAVIGGVLTYLFNLLNKG